MSSPRNERSRPGTTQDGSSAQQMVATTPSVAEVTAAIAVLERTLSPAQWLTLGHYFGLESAS